MLPDRRHGATESSVVCLLLFLTVMFAVCAEGNRTFDSRASLEPEGPSKKRFEMDDLVNKVSNSNKLRFGKRSPFMDVLAQLKGSGSRAKALAVMNQRLQQGGMKKRPDALSRLTDAIDGANRLRFG